MTIDTLLQIMKKQLKLHKSLYDLSARKTEMIKKGDMAALDKLLKDEQAHLAAISKLEEERLAAAKAILPAIDNPSLAKLADAADAAAKAQLLQAREELLAVIEEIKARNGLNQQLIHQSMQFINFSRSLVVPQQKEINYGPPAGKKVKPEQSPGLFNSKA
ncbi:flagellar protein FlgN [Bacillus sp. REN3]|uniref:flagellar protein FlgN n=1 Tax=Bacillus sp. REN3 TaxID=2802440 RepID=UPI001AED437F